jgi:flagellar hook assembly protein FlgD
LSGTAHRVNIEVLGANNEIIRTLSSTAPENPGTHQVLWDGLSESGDRVPEGVYRFRVKAEDVNKQPVPNFTFARERVMTITFGTESPVVLQSGKTLHTDDILSVL